MTTKARWVKVYGARLLVPPRIQRLDAHGLAGWQVRWGKPTKYFADGIAGPSTALGAAVDELAKRYRRHPPPLPIGTSLRIKPLAHKQNDLPPGISGPVLRYRKGRAPYAEFKVSLPRAGRANAGTTVYIGTQRNWCAQRYDAALAKAVKLREEAVDQLLAKWRSQQHREGQARR
jgi:hypothetical protein